MNWKTLVSSAASLTCFEVSYMLSHTREMYFSCEQCNYSCKLSLQKDSVKTNALKQATFSTLHKHDIFPPAHGHPHGEEKEGPANVVFCCKQLWHRAATELLRVWGQNKSSHKHRCKNDHLPGERWLCKCATRWFHSQSKHSFAICQRNLQSRETFGVEVVFFDEYPSITFEQR